jgi:hypothetical protein
MRWSCRAEKRNDTILKKNLKGDIHIDREILKLIIEKQVALD